MSVPMPLSAEDTVVVAIDFQERLYPAMDEKEKLLKNVVKLIKGAVALEIPVIVTEQYPKGLGPTIPEVKELLPDFKAIEKICFSCCDNDAFCQVMGSLKRKQVLVAGIEAHICAYQTAMALASQGYEVQIVSDCISSREPENKAVALQKMTAAGILPTSAEMALFELLKAAQGDKFKQVSSIIK